MKKQLVFNEHDKALIKKIEIYQKENNIKSFVETVRQLCRAGLSLNVSVKIDLNQKM